MGCSGTKSKNDEDHIHKLPLYNPNEDPNLQNQIMSDNINIISNNGQVDDPIKEFTKEDLGNGNTNTTDGQYKISI
jgi:ribosomal protein S16